jgi:hypothetical protein
MSSTTVLINTDANGDFAYAQPFFGLLNAVQLVVGDLDTGSLDVLIEDATSGTTFHDFASPTGDAYFQPSSPFPVYGSLSVTVASGGDTKHGHLRFMVQT